MIVWLKQRESHLSKNDIETEFIVRFIFVQANSMQNELSLRLILLKRINFYLNKIILV